MAAASVELHLHYSHLICPGPLQAKPDMDGYLHLQEVANPKQPVVPFAEDFAPPYSVNMSLLLPDVSYLHPGLSRTMRGIKREAAYQPPPPTTHGPCQENGALPLTDYPGGFGATDGNFLVKQEVADFPDVPLFQLLNSDLEPLIQAPQLTSISESYQLTGRQQRPQHLPLSPPQSTTSSPGSGMEQLSHNLSPPPSYEASIASKLHFHSDQGQTCAVSPAQGSIVGLASGAGRPTQTPVQTAVHVGPRSPVLAQSAPFKSNRKNNPDLERRRIHHCDVPGESRLYFYRQGRRTKLRSLMSCLFL